jgi:hypothetical protein
MGGEASLSKGAEPTFSCSSGADVGFFVQCHDHAAWLQLDKDFDVLVGEALAWEADDL